MKIKHGFNEGQFFHELEIESHDGYSSMEEKTFPFEIKALTEEGQFEGYAAIFGGKPDKFNEIIEKGAFKKTLQEKTQFPVLWYHDPRSPVGMAEASVDSKGLKIIGQLNLAVQLAQEKYALMKQKVIRGLSIGFRTITDTWKDRVRYIKEIKLYEVSLATFQMHPKALISNVKQLAWDEQKPFKSMKGMIEFLTEFKAGKVISSANLKLINNALEALSILLTASEPSQGTRIATVKGLFSSVIEELETENKPHLHLFGSTVKTLENTK